MDKEEKDLFVHATSEGGAAPQVTFVDDFSLASGCYVNLNLFKA